MSLVLRLGESRTRTLAHVVRAVHATTKAPVAVRATFVDEPPPGWVLRVTAGAVVVSKDTRARPPAAPLRLRLVAADGTRLAAPEAVVALGAATVTHEFAPAPAVLEVQLVKPDQTPRTGAVLRVRPTTGTAVPLAESAGGVYRSPERVWTSAFHPLDIRLGTTSLRRVSIDPTSRLMRVRLVDTT